MHLFFIVSDHEAQLNDWNVFRYWVIKNNWTNCVFSLVIELTGKSEDDLVKRIIRLTAESI